MSRSASHDILFDSVQVGPKTLKNRLIGVPYSPGFGPTKPRAHVAHREVQAEGGWSAIFTGINSPSEDFEVEPHVDTLWDEDDARMLARQIEAIQAHDALAGVELGHAGADALNRVTRMPAVAPSQLTSWRRPTVTPKAMEESDIDRIQAATQRAAEAAVGAGCDLLCAYGSFSYLPAQFLSPFYNRRSDSYGGSLANRARFWLEMLERIRGAVEGRCAISSRIAAAGLSPIGISLEETLEFIRMADDLVDYWDVNIGALWARESASSRMLGEGHAEEWIIEVREATDKPVVAIGRYTSPDRMAAAVRSGVCDLLGAARPRIADPFLPEKIRTGRYDEIRECTGSNFCVATHHVGQLACVQNPTVGEEYRRGWHPESVPPLEDADRSFLVVGAGPAGMECALTLAKRGATTVHLVDQADEVGGFMRWATSLPGLGEWARVINWRKIQLHKHRRRVRTILNTRLSLDDALEYGADVVIVATGASWAVDGQVFGSHVPVPGADPGMPHVLTPEQIVLDGKRPPGERVAIYDGDGDYMAPALAQKLASEGFAVEIVTPHVVVSPFADERSDGPFLREQLHEAGIGERTSTEITEISPGRVALAERFDDRREQDVDAVVLVTQRVSEDALYSGLVSDPELLRRNEIQSVYRIGDCLAPRDVGDVVYDAHRLAREIESDDPSLPLPPRREHLGAFLAT
ncbi:MAG: FAD-dependent oxidoreductase [Solirubrobacterales bacterium]